MEDDYCAVCADTLEWVAYGACGHKDVCSTCVARLRFICGDSCCCICKTRSDVVFVTKALGDYTNTISDFSILPSQPKEGRVGGTSYWYHEDTQAFFDDADHYKMVKAMCKLSCSVCDKKAAEEGTDQVPGDGSSRRRTSRFRNIEQLKGHLFHQHKLFMCSLCLEGRKVFICEQKLYSRSQLTQHTNTGDSAVDGSESERGGFMGHPRCEFCRTPFYGDNELYSHMSTEHFTCFICQRQHPGQYEYYKDYDDLEIHFRRDHFLCEDDSCLAKKFIVFSSESELKRHNAMEHGGHMSRSQRSAALQSPDGRVTIDLIHCKADTCVVRNPDLPRYREALSLQSKNSQLGSVDDIDARCAAVVAHIKCFLTICNVDFWAEQEQFRQTVQSQQKSRAGRRRLIIGSGTGSEILVYRLPKGIKIASFQVFEGIRVHGITSSQHHYTDDSLSFSYCTIAVYGERRVKLYKFRISCLNHTDHLELALVSSLPKFNHWVLDVCFLQCHAAGPSNWLGIGCSDNSVWFWDIKNGHVLAQVRCPDRCLLYSMRMWGCDAESLLIASGTIYNQIVVWKLDFEKHSIIDEVAKFSGLQYQVVILGRLVGHEGSIFRIAWSADGSKLVSASDDRSARVWVVSNARGDASDSPKNIHYLVGPVLFGHTARVWDCYVYDNLIVTAGEDCTCRVWGLDGQQLEVIKEHSGRGVWRCLYDPNNSLIVTAGLDSALKVYQMTSAYSSKTLDRSKRPTEEDSMGGNEVFTFTLPNSSGYIGLTDSKSEYVRCLHFSGENSLYVSTNNGYLHHLLFDSKKEEKWTELVHLNEGAPVVCMDVYSDTQEVPDTVDDWISMGNGKGSLMIVRVIGQKSRREVVNTIVWSAEIERQLLGTYWCKSLGKRFVFTADPKGQLKLWRLSGSLALDRGIVNSSPDDVCLISTYTSCYGRRIMCLDASLESEVLVCGDIHGNILLFPLSEALLFGTLVDSEVKTMAPVSYFKAAHGISRVCSVSITGSSLDQVEICSTGQDGCICYLECNKAWGSLEFVGMKEVKEISSVSSVFWNGDRYDNLDIKGYAVGFASSDFIIWNLTSDTKVFKVACGGWRRPHSYYVGKFPEKNTCFAFIKNEIIYVHRNWVNESDKELYPQNLHLQFHGREIHTVCFITGASECFLKKKHDATSRTVGIATGCEDGTVRLTRYVQGSNSWTSSRLLGEHVGGSAVRSLCCVSKLYKIKFDSMSHMPNDVRSEKSSIEELENSLLLISVGAKRVVTAWRQRYHGSSFLFQWLSSDMPTRKNRNQDSKRQIVEIEKEATTVNATNLSANMNKILKKGLEEDKYEENDWRYLAVSAFLVKVVTSSRISVCFVVVASSDATVTLRALLLPCRFWFDVAILSPSSSPVLALQHVIVSERSGIDDNLLVGRSVYIIISGSTDGSITFWDLTKEVEDFLRQVSSLQINELIDSHKRPQTGRGSQGGRWWRSFGRDVSKKKSCNQFQKGKTEKEFLSHSTTKTKETDVKNNVPETPGTLFHEEDASVLCHVKDEKVDGISLEVPTIVPLHVFGNIHQSGVNCLYVSDTKDVDSSKNNSTFCVLSGGDDQALNCLRFTLSMKSTSQAQQSSKPIYTCEIQNYLMKFISLETSISAHSSAVKDVWTDGHWAFSTGLDQRVRCWKLGRFGNLIEHSHLIVSVPEPEALDAHTCARNHYQIIVAGRGMQMLEFCPLDVRR
ncbi:OLC1v1003646C1 [Oldenlandia corymbosa var. corymbosa]|uniref:OLC1v1003646C1 n=1 Tax=Oldenlandia corymbosa var. corymbosa TaxID=529605 RepID=A0AAV1DD89_OLDCO|nr:OLC1v1003646C1 [Oldenlandia corymbosa var. corymbosa]